MHWLVSQRASQKLMRGVELFSKMDYSTKLEMHSKKKSQKVCTCQMQEAVQRKGIRERELSAY